MKRLFFLAITLLTTNMLGAQPDQYKTAIDNFEANYNAENYEAIFNGFSPDMKQGLPLEKTTQFLSGLKGQVGKMRNKEFVSFQQGTYATYKATFEKAVLAINISLNDAHQVNGLLIKPYQQPSKATVKEPCNALGSYPKEIADAIFSKAKAFPNNTQLAIAIIQNGRPAYYGITRVKDTIKPVENQHHVFEIGSITKVFTSSVLASLVAGHELQLTDDINAYYPFAFKGNVRISFKSLANHTSGLPRLPENLDVSNESNPYKSYGKKEIEDYLKNSLKLEREPLKTSAYSNLGAGLLGYTLGVAQKTSFQELLQKRIFDKYGMRSSYTSSKGLGDKLVKGLDKNGRAVSNWDFDALFGGGGILSTATDLSKFAIAQFSPENKELALTRVKTFDVNDDMQIGLGWHILKARNGKELHWHNGGTGGYSSSMAVNVAEKTAVIILSNVSDINDSIDELCFALINDTGKQ